MSKIVSLLLCFFCTTSLFADEIPKLSLNGQAVLYKPADQMKLTIGLTTIGKDAETALKENSEKMQKIINELLSSGLTKSEYQTGQFSIHPTFTPYPKNPPTDWKPSINGYEVTNTIQVKTEKIHQIGALIDAASRAGANKIEDIQATLKDESNFWAEAIALATKSAIEYSQVMAEAANVKLLRLLSISLNETHVRPPPPQPMANMLYKAAAEASTPIEPGNIEIKAHVTVVYEIGK